MFNPLEKILEAYRVAKAQKGYRKQLKTRYGLFGPGSTIDPKAVATWRQQQEDATKEKQYETAAQFMATSEGSLDIAPHIKKIKSHFASGGGGHYEYINPKNKTRISVPNVNTRGVPDIRIHRAGSVTPTSVIEVASGANKMWGDLSVRPKTPLSFAPGSVFHRLVTKGVFTPDHVKELQKAVDSRKSPRVAKINSIGKDGRHSVFAEVERHLRANGVTHIMVGGRIFPTDHSTEGVMNFSHYVGATHVSTAGAGKTKRLVLRVKSLRDPQTGDRWKGNEGTYNQTVADKGIGSDPSTLL